MKYWPFISQSRNDVALGARKRDSTWLASADQQRPATFTRTWRSGRNGNSRLTGNPARRPCSGDRRKRATLNDVAAFGPRNGRSTERTESLKAHAGPARDGRRGTVGCLGLPHSSRYLPAKMVAPREVKHA